MGGTVVSLYTSQLAALTTFAAVGERIGAAITEAVPANVGVVPPMTCFETWFVSGANGDVAIERGAHAAQAAARVAAP